MSEIVEIPLADLLLDVDNPRLVEIQQTQQALQARGNGDYRELCSLPGCLTGDAAADGKRRPSTLTFEPREESS